jgi:hypothetical protein
MPKKTPPSRYDTSPVLHKLKDIKQKKMWVNISSNENDMIQNRLHKGKIAIDLPRIHGD